MNASSNTQVHTDPQPKLLGGFPDRPGRLPLPHLPGNKIISPWKPQTLDRAGQFCEYEGKI